MEAFPFTEVEWSPLGEVALAIVNAGFAEDDALSASLRIQMRDLLDDLRERYGDHPVLLETTADYTDDDAERTALYRRAVEIAEANGLPTLGIRLPFARFLLDIGKPAEAREELLACEAEVPGGDEDDWKWWADMLAEANSTDPGAAPNPGRAVDCDKSAGRRFSFACRGPGR